MSSRLETAQRAAGMPSHDLAPSDATASGDAAATRPPRAPPRNLRGFQLGARRARGGLGGDLGGLGGHQSIKKSSRRRTRRVLSNSERPSCHIGRAAESGRQLPAGRWHWRGRGCVGFRGGLREAAHLLCSQGVEACAEVRDCTMIIDLWSKGAIGEVEKGGWWCGSCTARGAPSHLHRRPTW